MPLTENFYVMGAETGTAPLMRWGGRRIRPGLSENGSASECHSRMNLLSPLLEKPPVECNKSKS